jgi:hypothetical protein
VFSLSRKTIATILAIVMYGVGHIYLGAARRGIAILVIGMGLSTISYPGILMFGYVAGDSIELSTAMIIGFVLIAAIIVEFGFWVWQIFDARKVAKTQAIEA